MSADGIRARLARLREAGRALRARPADRTRAALGAVLDRWRDPASRWRGELEAKLPAATGFTPEVVREGLARGLDAWSGAALHDLVARELGGAAVATGFDVTAVLLAGSIPMPTLLSLVAPLALRSPVLAKPASRDPVTAPLVAASIADADPLLGACVETCALDHGDDEAVLALLGADCVVATGSDRTVAAVAARVVPPRRCVAYGHRLSLALVGPEATRGAALARTARGLALDTALWDQLGCLSPLAVLVADADPRAADRVAEALAEALADAEARWPRGAVDRAAAAAIAHERADAELRAAAGVAVALYAGDAWTVVREADASPRAAPLHRFLRVQPAPEPLAALAAHAPHLAGVAVAGFGAGTAALASGLAAAGASRVCAPGALQAPPLGWHHDGQGVLLPLARLTDVEIDG